MTRLMIMWRRPYHLTGDQAAEWARHVAEQLAASDVVARAMLAPLHSAADGHVSDGDWLLELHPSPGVDARRLVEEVACAEWLSELRQLGTEPRVMLAERGIGLRPLDG